MIVLITGVILLLTPAYSSFILPIPELPNELYAAGVEVGPPSSGSCSDTLLNSCQFNFNEVSYNILLLTESISSNMDWHVPTLLLNEIHNIYITQGVRGHIAVCSAYQAYRQCLGSSYKNCMNPLHFIKHGYSSSNSFFFAAIFGQLDFQCGGGFNDFIRNYACINSTAGTNSMHTAECYSRYTTGVSANPNSVCRLTNTLMACVRQPFAVACDPAASWFTCEYIRRGLFLPSCNLRCFVGQVNRFVNQTAKRIDQKLSQRSKFYA